MGPHDFIFGFPVEAGGDPDVCRAATMLLILVLVVLIVLVLHVSDCSNTAIILFVVC